MLESTRIYTHICLYLDKGQKPLITEVVNYIKGDRYLARIKKKKSGIVSNLTTYDIPTSNRDFLCSTVNDMGCEYLCTK